MALVPHVCNHDHEPAFYENHYTHMIHQYLEQMLHTLHLDDLVGNKYPTSLLTKDGFKVSLDVQEFQPNEITVKACDNTIVVEGKHDEKDDQCGSITRHFVRKYPLPRDIDITDLHTSLSSDGILDLKAPKKGPVNEHLIPIQNTGPVRETIKN